MGRGSERVYAYTFSSYQRAAGPYPIKVGMTRSSSAEHRIAQQIGASNAETPILLLDISCDHAALLEQRLHGRLKSRHISDVPGKEWFNTTPEQIVSHVRSLDPSHVETLSQGMMVLVGWAGFYAEPGCQSRKPGSCSVGWSRRVLDLVDARDDVSVDACLSALKRRLLASLCSLWCVQSLARVRWPVRNPRKTKQ